MKKKTLFIVLGIILVLVVGGIALFSSLNKEKESMTASEFKTLMEGKGLLFQMQLINSRNMIMLNKFM